MAKLNLIQRFFISVGQYDKTISEKMPEIIDSLIAYLEQLFENEENRETIVSAFSKALSDLKKKKLKTLLKEQSIDAEAKISELVPSFLDFLDRNKIGEKIATGITMFLVKNSGETVGEAIKRIFGLTPAQASDYLAGLLTEKNFAKNAASMITGFVVDFMKSRDEQTVGGFFGITVEIKEQIDNRACQALADVLMSKIPEAIQSLDIKSLVVNKINALDVESVENLLLMVIARHLKWINIFGAILGALIGLIQSVISLFM
ncbi:MAG: DUF445 family protein [Spirochaetaceae bacterium]|nr:MAG: DUF445 family protein [Spirochaetaceae bacterium]